MSMAPKDMNYPVGYHKKFHVKGIYYKCQLDPTTQRQDVIFKCTLESEIYLQRYFYEGKPAYLIVLADNNLDIGVVPADIVPTIEKYRDRESRIVITDIYNFKDEEYHHGVEVQFQVKKKDAQNDTPHEITLEIPFESALKASQTQTQNRIHSSAPVKAKKKHLWAWILGWIFFFPIPVTILLWRTEKLSPKAKYGLIIGMWVLLLIIGIL